MRNKLLILPFALAFGFALSACDDDDDGGGNACDQAAATLAACIDSAETGGDGGSSTVECTGDDLAAAECVNNNPTGACEFANDPLNAMPSQEVMDYLTCVTG